MGYLRSLFLALTIAVQLVTLAYVLVILGNSQSYDDNRSIVNATDARAAYYLSAVATLMTLGMAVVLWRERGGRPRQIVNGPTAAPAPPVRSARRSRGDGSSGTSDTSTSGIDYGNPSRDDRGSDAGDRPDGRTDSHDADGDSGSAENGGSNSGGGGGSDSGGGGSDSGGSGNGGSESSGSDSGGGSSDGGGSGSN